jgi:hypothetical protein
MPTRKRTPLGRPTEIPDRVRLHVYVTGGEARRIALAAKRAHVSVSAWMRARALAALSQSHEEHA